MKSVNTTSIFYQQVVLIEQHFNRVLFAGELPSSLISLKRGLGSLGHFAADRWQHVSSIPVGEIALDPSLFAQHSWLALMETIAHQQCHLWQHCFGTPGRPGYHNAEWADKMEAIGLVVSAVGRSNGNRTGQRIFQYAKSDGRFIQACAELAESDLEMPLVGRFLKGQEIMTVPDQLVRKMPKHTLTKLCACIGVPEDTPEIASAEETKVKKRKVKYSCPVCAMNVWGRQGLELQCQSCNQALQAATKNARRAKRFAEAQ